MNREDAVESNERFDYLDSAIEFLQEYGATGQNVYIDFDGHRLYSCDITVDSAYMEVHGLTKEQYDALVKEKKQVEKEGDKRAMKAFYEKRDSIVEANRLRLKEEAEMKKNATPAGIMYLSQIDNAIKYLQYCKEQGQNVYIEIDGHKLYSYNVTEYSAYMEVTGLTKEQYDARNKELSEAITEDKKNAIIEKYNLLAIKSKAVEANERFSNLDMAIEYLQEYGANGQNVYIDFDGHRLYSCDITVDSAYMEVKGVSKEEFEAIIEERDQAKNDRELKMVYEKYYSMIEANRLRLKEEELVAAEAEVAEISREEEELGIGVQEEQEGQGQE